MCNSRLLSAEEMLAISGGSEVVKPDEIIEVTGTPPPVPQFTSSQLKDFFGRQVTTSTTVSGDAGLGASGVAKALISGEINGDVETTETTVKNFLDTNNDGQPDSPQEIREALALLNGQKP